jgi:hypothetical protein
MPERGEIEIGGDSAMSAALLHWKIQLRTSCAA